MLVKIDIQKAKNTNIRINLFYINNKQINFNRI